MKLKNIVIIGSGNLASNLAAAFSEAGLNIVSVFSRELKNAKLLAKKYNSGFTNQIEDIPTNADLYVIALKDGVIKEIGEKLSDCKGIVVHTSGSIPMSVFADSIKNVGVFYPLMIFSKKNIISFKDIPICLEANNKETLVALDELGKSISNHVFEVSSEKRKALHLAAVFACNFTNLNYAIAEDLLNQNQLSFDLIKPLIHETSEKIMRNSPSEIKTGPAFREDHEVMHQQLEMLNEMTDYKKMYELLSSIIISKKQK